MGHLQFGYWLKLFAAMTVQFNHYSPLSITILLAMFLFYPIIFQAHGFQDFLTYGSLLLQAGLPKLHFISVHLAVYYPVTVGSYTVMLHVMLHRYPLEREVIFICKSIFSIDFRMLGSFSFFY